MKSCERCGSPLVLPPNATKQQRWQFHTKRYCDRSCMAGHKRKAAKKQPPTKKTCPTCGETFTRPKAASSGTWARQVYCSPTCFNTRVVPGPVKSKTCEHCGKPFTLPADATAGARLNWERRRFCGTTCGSRGRQGRQNELRAVKRKTKPRPLRMESKPERSYDSRDTYRRQGLQPLEAIPAHLKAVDLEDALRMALDKHGDEWRHALSDADRVARESPAKPFTTRPGARYLA